MSSTDVLIQGAGVVGRTLALCLGQLGLNVVLHAPLRNPDRNPDGEDVRAYALNAESVALLRQLRVWEALPPHAVTPVYDMRIEGDAQSVLTFSAWQQAVSELAWIVDVPALEAVLDTAVRFAPQVQVVSGDAQLPDAALTAICEGRLSPSHQTRGVMVHRQSYGQTAIAARLSATLPHAGVARQWFCSPDVLALLPCAAGADGAPAYALVWSLPSARAAELMAASDAAFEAALTQAVPLEAAVGGVKLISRRSDWPLSRLEVEPWCGTGWVLVGDAAHGIHPLAGQGLNLGLADVVSLQQVLRGREPWRSVGDAKLLRRHVRRRALPTRAMGDLTGGLMHLFAHPASWARELRNQGLNLVQHAPGLKRWLAAQARHLDARPEV